MMALSALRLSHQNELQTADALEHYQKVIPAMRATVQSSQDSFGDGALFTHFLLLLYEVGTFFPLFLYFSPSFSPSPLFLCQAFRGDNALFSPVEGVVGEIDVGSNSD
jgi:hypothetical protein